METARKGRMLPTVSTDKWEPWSANKWSYKDKSIDHSERRNYTFKVLKYFMFTTMSQMTSSSYVQPKLNGPNLLEVDSGAVSVKLYVDMFGAC